MLREKLSEILEDKEYSNSPTDFILLEYLKQSISVFDKISSMIEFNFAVNLSERLDHER
jgi:hypothetical protein